MGVGIATFGPGTQTGIDMGTSATPLSGGIPLSGATQQSPFTNPYYGSGNITVPGGTGGTTPPPTNPTGTTTGGTGTNPGFNADVLGQAYDAQIAGYGNQLNQNQVFQGLDTNSIGNQFDVQRGGLDSQYATGQANHNLAQNQLDTSRTNSVRDLGDQLRGALAGYNNQLGVQGAGNSSAAQMIGYALQQQGNRGMSDLNQQYDQQQQGLNVAGSALEQQYQQNVKALDLWKQTNLQQIAEKYAQLNTQIQQAQLGASTSKVQALSYQNQAAAQAALQQMQQLEQTYGDQMQNIHTAYSQAAAPTVDVSQYANAFNVNPLSTAQIQATNLGNNQQDTVPTNTNIPVSLQKKSITQPF